MPTGVWPVNPSTAVGLFRIDIGDDTPLVTPGSGDVEAEFEFFSDDTIEAFIARDDEIELAQSKALDSMARRLILQAQDIQVDDIKIKTLERAKLFAEHADKLREAAVTGAASGTFTTVSLSGFSDDTWPPQGTPRYYGTL